MYTYGAPRIIRSVLTEQREVLCLRLLHELQRCVVDRDLPKGILEVTPTPTEKLLGHILEAMATLFEQERVLDLGTPDLASNVDPHVRQHVHVELGIGEDPDLPGIGEDMSEVRQQ